MKLSQTGRVRLLVCNLLTAGKATQLPFIKQVASPSAVSKADLARLLLSSLSSMQGMQSIWPESQRGN
jgi:hypothetical protein